MVSVARVEAPVAGRPSRRGFPRRFGNSGRNANQSPTAAAIVTTQNCQSCSGIGYAPPPRIQDKPANIAAPPSHASTVIHASWSAAHFHEPDSRRTSATVGRHCIAST
jgi:hypothetical protein